MSKVALPPIAAQLSEKIQKRQAKVAVVGMGYVGLPLAVEFAKAGLNVIGIDVTQSRIDAINRGESYIGDVSSDELRHLVKSGQLRAAKPGPELGEADTISICVPTPLRKSKDPDISYIVSATDEIVRYLRRGQLIVLESTTYPGTTDEVIRPRLVEKGFTIGVDLFLSFSPERVDPGNPKYNTRNTPKVIGGTTPACTEVTAQLYSLAVDTVVRVSSTQAAEMVKLLENTFRLVNIGLVNELAIVCEKLGMEVWEVIDAAATKPFGFMPFWPGPGLGGHCIPIDPHYLSWKMKMLNYHTRFIELAETINSTMPEYVVDKVAELLNTRRKCMNGSRFLVLGLAYKKDVDDIRESPALDVIKLLRHRGGTVDYSDPFVPEANIEGQHMVSVAYTRDTLSRYDCVVVVTNHSKFDAGVLVESGALCFDARNLTKGHSAPDRIKKL